MKQNGLVWCTLLFAVFIQACGNSQSPRNDVNPDKDNVLSGANANVVYIVNSTEDAVDKLAGDGVCATAEGLCTLRAAIMEANAAAPDSVKIELPSGLYALNLVGNNEDHAQNGDLDLSGNMLIAGAGPASTVIDGTIAGERLLQVKAGANVNVSGLTLRNGFSQNGGAMLIEKARVKLQDIRMTGNKSQFGNGGAIHSMGVVNAESLVLENNESTRRGGAVYLAPATDAIFRLKNSVIRGNKATGNGGAIFGDGGASELDGCDLLLNQALQGGAIYGSGTDFTVANSTIATNKANSIGGGIFQTAAPFRLVNSTISDNSSEGNSGGGIYNIASGSDYAFSIVNSTISGNRASVDGGGIWNKGSMSMAFVTVYDNFAQGSGGGLSLVDLGYLNVAVIGTIIAGNQASSNGEDCFGPLNSFGNNVFGITEGCVFTAMEGDLAGVDPMLSPLADNGGLTNTHAVQPGSNLVDHVPAAACTDLAGTALVADQRGAVRPQGTGCEPGAYEYP